MRCLKWMLNLILALYLAVVGAVTVPSLLGVRIFTVISGSMAPDIPAGSVVYTLPRAFEEIRAGDIVTYRQGESGVFVTHRVIGTDPENQVLITRGDANAQPDGGGVSRENLVGRVQFSVPYLGYAAVLLDSAGEKLLVLGGFLWLLLVKGIVGDWIKMRRKEATIL